jgi:uncharacterized protein YjbI with pentapeptide repeats
MEVINHTPFQFAYLVGRVNFPAYSLTLIVKGTFDCIVGKSVQQADEQLFPTGDVYQTDDMQGSCTYESDFAYFKPRADLLLTGKCHAPEAKPSQAFKAVFQVGNITKTLAVFGRRYWKGLSPAPSNPEMFTEMPLCYENSFGGKDFNKNPVGTGYLSEQHEREPRELLLPTIEDPRQLIHSSKDCPEPAGFGPLGKMWSQRYAKIGTYTDKYVDQRWPWFPNDFDWGYFNAAPQDMQVEGYLKGDEPLYFQNLHPLHSQYHCNLPGLRIRCFINTSDSSQQERAHFKEVPLNLDTLWVDMEAEKLVLAWRGVTQIKGEDFEEIQHLFLVAENLSEEKGTLAHYHQVFKNHFLREEQEHLPESPQPGLAETDIEQEIITAEKEVAKAEETLRAELLAAGISPDINTPPLSDEDKAYEARLLKKYFPEKDISPDEQSAPFLARDDFKKALLNSRDFTGKDLSNFDLSELDLQGVDFQGALLSGANLRHSNLANSKLAEADLSNADLSGSILQKSDARDADFTAANLTGVDLSGALLENALLEKARMQKSILTNVQAKGAFFSEANLTGATCINGIFDEADFSRANLNHADFQGASLKEASVEGAEGNHINLDNTDISRLRASEGIKFRNATLRKVTGAGSIWTGADLTEADFSLSDLPGADFSSSTLKKANLFAADMKGAKFRRAKMQQARCISMNLFQGSLEKADLTDTDFSGSNLYGVEFLDAIVIRTKFQMANLKMTKLAKKNG